VMTAALMAASLVLISDNQLAEMKDC